MGTLQSWGFARSYSTTQVSSRRSGVGRVYWLNSYRAWDPMQRLWRGAEIVKSGFCEEYWYRCSGTAWLNNDSAHALSGRVFRWHNVIFCEFLLKLGYNSYFLEGQQVQGFLYVSILLLLLLILLLLLYYCYFIIITLLLTFKPTTGNHHSLLSEDILINSPLNTKH